MRENHKWIMKMGMGGLLLMGAACNRPERQGVPPEPRVEESEDPGTSGGAPKPGPDTGPDTPAL